MTDAPAVSPFSGLPKVLQENLPPYFRDRPATAEFVYAFVKAWSYGASILVIAAAQAGAFATFSGTIEWFVGHWWGVFWAGILAYSRGKEAHGKAVIATKLTATKAGDP